MNCFCSSWIDLDFSATSAANTSRFAHRFSIPSLWTKVVELSSSSFLGSATTDDIEETEVEPKPRHSSLWVWYFCLYLPSSPGHPICPLLGQECVSPWCLLQSLLSSRSHCLISSLPDGEEFQPPPAAANTRTSQTTNDAVKWRGAQPPAQMVARAFGCIRL